MLWCERWKDKNYELYRKERQVIITKNIEEVKRKVVENVKSGELWKKMWYNFLKCKI